MKAKPTYEELERRVHELKTDNTQLEKKLLEASSFAEEVMTYMTEGFVLADTRGTVIFINQRLSEMLGYLPEEITGKCWLDMVSIEQQVVAQEEEARRAHGHIGRYEIVLRHKNGENFPVLICAGPRFDKQSGQYIGSMAVVNDITERKRAEEALRETKAILQAAMDCSPAGIAIADADGQLRYVNDAGLFIRGGDRQSVVNGVGVDQYVASWNLFDLDGRPLRTDEVPLARAIMLGETNSRDFIVRRKGCEDRIVAANAAPIKDETGKTTAGIVVFTDITERKRAEDLLKASKEMLAETESIGKVGGWSFNIDTMEQIWTDEVYRIHEVEIRPNPSIESGINYYTKESRPIIKKAVQRAIEHGENFDLELEIITAKGNTRAVHTIGKADLTNRRIYGFFHDITERKQAEKELELAHKKILTILDSMDSTVYVADMDTYKILFMNKNMITAFGGDKTGDICYHAFRKSSEPCECCTNNQLVDKDGNPTGVCIWDGKNPVTGKHYINYDRAIEWADGRLVRMQIATDITDLKKMEAQLNQAQKIESVGRLAGGVAHDFNNMLGVILGHTEMALDDVDPSTPLYANLHAVQQAAERSADLTRQLLAFARKQTIAPKVIDLNKTVEGMFNMLRRLIGEDIDLLWQPGRNLQPVKVDPSQIDQLLANLCVNARDAIDGVGKITIETDAKTFDDAYCSDHFSFLPGKYILLAVSDNGCGMDKTTLDQIFEPFFTTKKQGKGTGLGLASVFGMVKQNNGFINVYSEPGQGTTIKIYLPVYEAKSAGVVETAPNLPTEKGNETILLVEDESAILEMTTMMLTRLGYTVVAAATPGEAIRLAHEYQGRIDLLMTDVVMPEMNGRELAGNLLSHYPDLKRLFMSGYTANVIAHHGVLDQGVHFIQKPFSKKDLGAKLREVLEG